MLHNDPKGYIVVIFNRTQHLVVIFFTDLMCKSVFLVKIKEIRKAFFIIL